LTLYRGRSHGSCSCNIQHSLLGKVFQAYYKIFEEINEHKLDSTPVIVVPLVCDKSVSKVALEECNNFAVKPCKTDDVSKYMVIEGWEELGKYKKNKVFIWAFNPI